MLENLEDLAGRTIKSVYPQDRNVWLEFEDGEQVCLGFVITDYYDPGAVGVVVDPPPTYDSNFGDDRICECGHPYYRHFDSYDQNYPIGCKYCHCRDFVERTEHSGPYFEVGI